MKKKFLLMNSKSFFFFIIVKICIITINIFFLSIYITNKYFNKEIYIFGRTKRKFKKRINYTRKEALTRGRNFLNICLQEKLINNLKFKKSKNPIITVIVPIYNREPYIKKVIRSIQNQSILDIEIILVNDLSTDNTLKIIEKLQTEDPRIEIINNEKNMGILYSRSLGVLNAKGKYIVPLDHDDFFFDDDVFEVIYEEAEKTNFDMISIMEVEIKKVYTNIIGMRDGCTTHQPDGLIIKQPELPYFPFFKNNRYSIVDVDIWGKIYRTEIYKKAVNLLGIERYSIYNFFNEDQIDLFAICIVSKPYKYVRKYGIFHIMGHKSALNRVKIEHLQKMRIFFIEEIFDLSKFENKKYGLFLAISFNFNNINEDNKLYLRVVLKKILECEYIESNLKQELTNKYKNILI